MPIAGGTARPSLIKAEDAATLPNTFGVAAADAAQGPDSAQQDPAWHARHRALQERLATVFRQALLPYLFENNQCGHSPVCDAPASDPFEPLA